MREKRYLEKLEKFENELEFIKLIQWMMRL